MNIKKLILVAALPVLGFNTMAQESPKSGDMTLAVTVGYNSYIEAKALPSAKAYETEALSTNWSDKKLMTGVEFGMFVADQIKITVGGGFNFTHKPGYAELPGTETGSAGDLPSYRAIADAQNITYTANLNVDKYFNVNGLNLFAGLHLGGSYVQNAHKYDEASSMGKSIAECWAGRGAIAAGADYFFSKNFFVGMSVDVFAYTYGMASYKPQEGIKPLQADSHDMGFMSAPLLKVGFKF